MGRQSQGSIVIRGLAMAGQLRFVVALSTPITKLIIEAHQPSTQGLLALSRAATAVGLLSATIKGRQQIGIQVNGDGPLGELYALSNAKGELRVTATSPQATASPESDVGAIVGSGRFTLIKTSDAGEPYRGTVPIFTGGIAEDLAYYFAQSEQIPTACGIGERVEEQSLITGGYLVQCLPDADEATMSLLERRVVMLPTMQEMLSGDRPLYDLLEGLFDDDYEILQESDICFNCPCQRTQYARTLLTLGKEELTEIREQTGEMNIVCHFCATKYHFNYEEIGALIYGARP
jgi:molecular chaperone Hsp33